MKTPRAESDPERSVTVTMHTVDLIELLQGLRLLNKQPHHFDLSAPDYRPLYVALVQRLRELDPEYVRDMLDGAPPHPRESPVHRPFQQKPKEYCH